MRKPLLLMVLLTISIAGINAQTKIINEQSKVKDALTNFFDGIATLDARLMKQQVTKDFLLLENGAVWNIDTLVGKLSPLKTLNFSRKNYIDIIRTDIKGNMAWVAYNNAADMSMGGQAMHVQWLESAVLVKDKKNWKIQLLHSTRLSPQPN